MNEKKKKRKKKKRKEKRAKVSFEVVDDRTDLLDLINAEQNKDGSNNTLSSLLQQQKKENKDFEGRKKKV